MIEILIVLALSGIVAGTTTMTIFQVLDGNARTNNHMDAISRVQNAGFYVSRDAEQAQIIDPAPDPDPDGFPLTLAWRDWEDSDEHMVIYSIIEDDNKLKLKREYSENGGLIETLVFDYILSTDPDTGELKTYCTRSDDGTLHFTLTAIVGVGSHKQTETRVYEVIPRPTI